MTKLPETVLENARRALLEGNRSEVEHLLRGHEESSEPEIRWLLASASQDPFERKNHLEAIVRLSRSTDTEQNNPYAKLAADIIQREDELEREISKAPKWQRFIAQNAKLMIVIIAAMVLLVGGWVISVLISAQTDRQSAVEVTSQATNQRIAETATGVLLTPTSTMSFFPSALSVPVNYPPFGSLRVLMIEFPSQRVVIDERNGEPQNPPVNSQIAAVVYEFTCGIQELGYCDNPPEAIVSLELANGQRVPKATLQVDDPFIPPPSSIHTGNVVRGWLVFTVPNGQIPAALILEANTDSATQTLEEIRVPFPPS